MDPAQPCEEHTALSVLLSHCCGAAVVLSLGSKTLLRKPEAPVAPRPLRLRRPDGAAVELSVSVPDGQFSKSQPVPRLALQDSSAPRLLASIHSGRRRSRAKALCTSTADRPSAPGRAPSPVLLRDGRLLPPSPPLSPPSPAANDAHRRPAGRPRCGRLALIAPLLLLGLGLGLATAIALDGGGSLGLPPIDSDATPEATGCGGGGGGASDVRYVIVGGFSGAALGASAVRLRPRSRRAAHAAAVGALASARFIAAHTLKPAQPSPPKGSLTPRPPGARS